MPQFGHQDGFDTVSYITGPSHVLLGIRFAEDASAPMTLIRRSGAGTCDHGLLDEQRIAEAVRAGVAEANAESGGKLAITQAFYVDNDSPRVVPALRLPAGCTALPAASNQLRGSETAS